MKTFASKLYSCGDQMDSTILYHALIDEFYAFFLGSYKTLLLLFPFFSLVVKEANSATHNLSRTCTHNFSEV